MRNKYEVISALGATLLLSASAAQASDGLDEYRQRFEPLPHLPPLPATNSQTEEKVELGNMLFFEPRISSSGLLAVPPVITLRWDGQTAYLAPLAITAKLASAIRPLYSTVDF